MPISHVCRALVTRLADRSSLESSRVPDNKADYGFAEALASAWKAYGNPR